MDSDDRTTATGLWMFGECYFQAAKHLAESAELRFDAPIYFLYSHSIELVLKAFLRAYGATLDDLRHVGHALPALLNQCRSQGLDPGPSAEEDLKLITLLDLYNRDHEFRYIVTGYKTLPVLKELHDVAYRLICATQNGARRT